MENEPKDTTMAFIWNLAQFADATSDATNYQPEAHRTRHFQAVRKARKHARRMMSLAGLYPNDPDSRQALMDLVGSASDGRAS